MTDYAARVAAQHDYAHAAAAASILALRESHAHNAACQAHDAARLAYSKLARPDTSTSMSGLYERALSAQLAALEAAARLDKDASYVAHLAALNGAHAARDAAEAIAPRLTADELARVREFNVDALAALWRAACPARELRGIP